MNRLIEVLTVFGIGGFLYGGIEIAFRGFTHWSMFLAGGTIFVLLYNLFAYIGKGHFLLKCILGCAIITTIEFITGVGVNMILGLNVWDYSDKAANLFGQICIAFSIGWFFISIPASLLADFVRSQFNSDSRATKLP